MSTPHHSYHKQPKLVSYTPIFSKRHNTKQENYEHQQLSGSKTHSQSQQLDNNESEIENREFQAIEESTKDHQELQYFTASFKTLAVSSNYQTLKDQEQDPNYKARTYATIQEEDIMEDSQILDDNLVSTQIAIHSSIDHNFVSSLGNAKINTSINPRLLTSKGNQSSQNFSYLDSQDFRDSIQSLRERRQSNNQQLSSTQSQQREQIDIDHEEQKIVILDDHINAITSKFMSMQQSSPVGLHSFQQQSNSRSDNEQSNDSLQTITGVQQQEKPLNSEDQQNNVELEIIQRKNSQNRSRENGSYYESNVEKSKTPRFFNKSSQQQSSNQNLDQFSDNMIYQDEVKQTPTSQSNNTPKPYETSKHYSTHKHSNLLSISQGFFIQQNDKLMGSLNDFVETKISSLNFMIQEKRRVQQMLEDQKRHLKQVRQDSSNLLRQQELHFHELSLQQEKQESLLNINDDMINNTIIIQEKILEKQEDYEISLINVQKQHKEQKLTIQSIQDNIAFLKLQQVKVRDIRTQEIQDIKEITKLSDSRIIELKKKVDSYQVNEKNRISYLQQKECTVMQLIQEDRIYTDQTNMNSVRKSQQRTPNHRFNKLDFISESHVKRDKSSNFQSKSKVQTSSSNRKNDYQSKKSQERAVGDYSSKVRSTSNNNKVGKNQQQHQIMIINEKLNGMVHNGSSVSDFNKQCFQQISYISGNIDSQDNSKFLQSCDLSQTSSSGNEYGPSQYNKLLQQSTSQKLIKDMHNVPQVFSINPTKSFMDITNNSNSRNQAMSIATTENQSISKKASFKEDSNTVKYIARGAVLKTVNKGGNTNKNKDSKKNGSNQSNASTGYAKVNLF